MHCRMRKSMFSFAEKRVKLVDFFFSKLFNVFVDSISSYFAASMVHNPSYRQSWSKFSNLFLMRFVTGRQELI